MKFKFLKQLALVLSLVVSANATAGIISSTDSHTTSDGSVVNLSGLDWLTWDVTTGQSRTNIEDGFEGLLDDGWRYATVTEYKTMMESVFDTHNGWSDENKDGARWIYNNLSGRTDDTGYGHIEFRNYWGAKSARFSNYYGADSECHVGLVWSCFGSMYFQAGRLRPVGYIKSGWSSWHDNSGYVKRPKAHMKEIEAVSSALVRANVVPEPSTLAIFALGMIGLASRRFKKQS